MDFTRARRTCAAAVLAFLLSAGPAPAEVKLRIYLQDGSLQSGTLVAENPKSFVILTQEGRQEIPKNSIMFINGKTLKQWQDRPDKLFQTEIIPSEIPNPAFVNDKSILQAPALPAAPAIKPSEVVAVEKKAPVRTKKEKAPPPEAEPSPLDAEVAEAKAERAAADRRAEAQKRAQEKKDAAAVMAVLAKEEKAKEKGKTKDPVVAVQVPSSGRGKFDRLAAGATHHERARAHRKNGDPGRAMQEYHYARLLEPYNPDIYLNLGMLYLDQGLRGEARKLFSHQSLRKSSEAKNLVARIDADLAAKKEADFRSRMSAGAAAFAWLPILIGIRLIRRRRKGVAKQTTISADDLQPADVEVIGELASPIPAATLDPEPILEEEETLVMEEPVAEPSPKTPASFPGLPEFLSNLTESPQPAPKPPVEEEAVASEPVYEPEPAPEPVVEVPPVPVAAATPGFPDPEEILSMARSVEHSLIRGNQWAVEGKLDEARRAYRTALALNAACVSAHIGLAYIAFCEEKWEVSLLHYRKAIQIDPMSADAHYGVARVLLEINRVDDAVPELRATLQIDPTYDDARDTLTALSKPA